MVLACCAGLAFSGCNGSSGGTSPSVPPEPLPPETISVEPAFANLTFVQPVALLQVPGDDSRWFVVEKAGVVRVFDDDDTVTTSAVFIDISTLVDSGPGEAGLLGMAFHPDFATNGFVFLSFTVTGSPLVSRIDRFTSSDSGQTLDPATQMPILSIDQDFSNHNGGNIAFGPDGFLYAGFGDGGAGGDPLNRAQTTDNLLGAMLRIDVDSGMPYAIPPDNPFAGNPTCPAGAGSAACPEIFAYGLRNPWRWSFDRQTGELYVGDVGQNAFEEIDRVTIGNNYGWNIREGANCFPPGSTCMTAGLIDPIHEYDHTVGFSVTGGYVYRGQNIASLVGRYVFGDFGTGIIWSIDAQAQSLVASKEVVDTQLSIASFGEGNDGELYVVSFSGTLHRLIAN